MKPFKINLDYQRDCYEEITVSMLDTVKLECTIMDNWEVADLTGATIQMQIGKPDGRFVIQTSGITTVGNIVNITLDSQATVVESKEKPTELTLVITKGGERKGFWIIKLKVKRTAIVDKVESRTEVPVLKELEDKVNEGAALKTNLTAEITKANTSKTELTAKITEGNTLKNDLTGKISEGNTLKTALVGQISTGTTLKTDLATKITEGTTLKTDLTAKVTEGTTLKNALATQLTTGGTLKTDLATQLTTGATLKTDLIAKVTEGTTLKNTLASQITTGGTLKTDLASKITEGTTVKNDLTTKIVEANKVKTDTETLITSGGAVSKKDLGIGIITKEMHIHDGISTDSFYLFEENENFFIGKKANGKWVENPLAITFDTMELNRNLLPSDASKSLGTEGRGWKDIHLKGKVLSRNGYTKLPNGFILQWVMVNVSWNGIRNQVLVTYPMAFPNAVTSLSVEQVSHPYSSLNDWNKGVIRNNNTINCNLELTYWGENGMELKDNGYEFIVTAIGY